MDGKPRCRYQLMEPWALAAVGPKMPTAAALETGFPLLSAQSGVSLPEAMT